MGVLAPASGDPPPAIRSRRSRFSTVRRVKGPADAPDTTGNGGDRSASELLTEPRSGTSLSGRDPVTTSRVADGEPPRTTWITTRLGEQLTAVISFLAVAGAVAFVVVELHPNLIFGSGIDVGGDNGGHIAAPYFLIHSLLPRGRLTGWDPWWFDGFPLYVFYFPLPALLVAIASGIWSYAVAFKIVTVLGTVTLPLCAYAFGRLAGYRRPIPVLMTACSLPFLFNTSYTIDGGNIVSTMAGEFSFSLAISTGLLFLGVTAYALRTGRLRWLAASLFAVTCVTHLVPGIAFGAAAAIFMVTTTSPRALGRAIRIVAPIGVVGALLAAWWLLPFGSDLQYSSSMNYLPVGGPWPGWFTLNFCPDGWLMVLIPAAIGALVAIVTRNRLGMSLTLCSAFTIFAFHWLPSGLVYNARWLPFWFLFTALLAAFGLGAVFRLIASVVLAPGPVFAFAVSFGTMAAIVGSVFLGGLEGNGFFGVVPPAGHQQVSGWVEWNNSGLQAKSGWGVWQGMVRLLDKAGRTYGCGRLQYEYLSETTDPFGSTEAMMSLPMFTHGCMETTDGIYFESSTTTPFHFLDVSEVSQNGESPDPVAGLVYPGFDVPDGIRHLQLMGVRYFLAMSPPTEAAAAADPSLVRIGSAPSFPGPYNNEPVKDPHMVLYLVKNSPLVAPLTHLPVVEQEKATAWLQENLKWYEEEGYWPTMIARDGPPAWPRGKPGTLVPTANATPAASTRISHIRTGTESISFDVTRTGTPVLVKIPYFPNWEASGATGPYEVSPNLMAVVPTGHRVTLTYGTTSVDWAGKAGSLLGILGVVLLGLTRSPPPAFPEPSGPLLLGEEDPDPEESTPSRARASETGLGVSVVLPAHNEEDLIVNTAQEVLAALTRGDESFEIIIVENGSEDGTAALSAELAAEHPQVRLVRLREADYGAALRAGFLAAEGDVVVYFDVDYYHVDFIERAIPLIVDEGASLVVTSKRAKGSSDRRPLVRRVLTAGFATAMRTLLRVSVSDAHGIKALDRRALSSLVEVSHMTGALFDVELVARAERAGLPIVELPVEVGEIRPARTSVARRTLDTFLGLLRLRWRLGPPSRP